MKKNYERLDVSFDLWKGESDAQPYIPDMVKYLKDNGLVISEEKFEEILDTYAKLRSDNDGAEYGMSWIECLAEAFESIVDDDDSD